jgi:proteasome regulatory subunit
LSGSVDDLSFSRGNEDSLVKVLEDKLKTLQLEVETLRKEVIYYKSEFEKLMSPPLIEGVVIDVLEDGRVIVRSSSGPNLIVNVSSQVDFSKIRPGVSVALSQRGSTVVEVLPLREDLLVKSMEVEERPNVKFSDIGGLEDQVRELVEVVQLPLMKPELFRDMGIDPPKGVLLYGPPGTGKTLLAKAVAAESNATFIHVIASEFAQKFVGEGARLVREVFQLARRKAPSIIFIDEIDAIAARRIDVGTSGEREIQRTLMQLLAEMDGFKPLDSVKILAATNRLDILDPAILRPGRFDRVVYVPLPDERGREEILRIYMRRMKVSKDVDPRQLASLTDGFSGADIKNLCVEAGYVAIRREKSEIGREDFLLALEQIGKRKRFNSEKGVERIQKFI